MIKKLTAFVIIFLFFGAGVVSSSGDIIENNNFSGRSLKSISSSEEILSRGKTAYAYIAYSGSSGEPEGPCYFDLDDPGTLTSFAIENCPGFLCGAWTNDEKWLVCDGNGSLWEIDLCDKTASEIGGGGTVFYGLTYNPVNEKLYGSTGDDLYEIDIDTGNPTYIGGFGISTIMIDIACDIDCVCYGWDVLFSGNSKLYTIDLETGDATEYADMGENLCYASSGSFDYETNILYIAACSYSCGFLIKVDFENGGISHIGNFEGCAYLSSLVIPDTDDFCPPKTTISLNPPEPDGCNGWYVSDVTIMLEATDDVSGVKEIRYRIDGWSEHVIPGDSGSFILHGDGEDILVEYWAVDYAGNVETKTEFELDIDRTVPEITLTYEYNIKWWEDWVFKFTATATDAMSGMDCVEFYANDILQETVTGPGPTYTWTIKYLPICKLLIRATAYDKAGLSESDEVYDPKISFNNYLKNIQQNINYLKICFNDWRCSYE